MLIIQDWLSASPLGPATLTIGVFDGLHLGHQSLVRRVIERAQAQNVSSLVLTFEPHPLVVLSPAGAPEILTSFDQKAELLAAMGLSALGRLRFDSAMSDLRALDFLESVVAPRVTATEIYVGEDFHFGRGAEGTVKTLMEWGQAQSPPVKSRPVPTVKGPKEETFSSSHIRGLIKVGLVEEAAAILGRPYSLAGTVVAGQARGRRLGYPTANLGEFPQLAPGPGVYVVRARLGSRNLGGMTSVGHNPTFNAKALTVETYLFDFSEDFYGARLEIEFLARLRGVIRFDSPQSLVRQLGEDEKMARTRLAKF